MNIGDTTSSIDAVFNTVGSFTPEAWYDSDKIKVQGNPITISDPVPNFDLKYNSQTGPTDINENIWNGAFFTIYYVGNDNNPKAYQIWNSAASLWEDLSDEEVIDFGNGDTGTFFKGFMGDPHMEININSSGSDRNFNIRSRLIDESNQSAEDTMNVSVLENIMTVTPYDSSGTELVQNPNIEIYHNMDPEWEIEFKTGDHTFATEIAVYISELGVDNFIENITPGQSYLRNIDFTGIRRFKFKFFKNSNFLEEKVFYVDGLDHNPNDPVIYEWDFVAGNWIVTDGLISIAQGIQLRYRIELTDDDNDTLELMRIIDGEWPYQMTTDETTPNEGDIYIKDISDTIKEIRMNTLNRGRGPPYTMRDYSVQTEQSPLESIRVDTDINVGSF